MSRVLKLLCDGHSLKGELLGGVSRHFDVNIVVRVDELPFPPKLSYQSKCLIVDGNLIVDLEPRCTQKGTRSS